MQLHLGSGNMECKDISKHLVNQAIGAVNGLYNAKTYSKSGGTKRQSKVGFIKDEQIKYAFLSIAKKVYKGVHLDRIEDLQYGEYHPEGEYGWHQDCHVEPYKDGRIRKVSFSVFLNDDFDGGEFDLEVYSPAVEKRYETFKLKPNTALFFKSDQWHRVRPVKSGVRKSIVGWVLGKQWK